MADPTLRERADRRYEKALAESGARDPRDFYRQRLVELRERDPHAFKQALDYFENRLVPAVADERSDAVSEWLEYGRVLAKLTLDGTTVQIDRSGRATAYARPLPLDRLVLHLPTSTREKALVVGLPADLSPAQRATYQLLVAGAQE